MFLPKKCDFADFQNALISQPLDGFLFPTPEMKARDAYVPFLMSKQSGKILRDKIHQVVVELEHFENLYLVLHIVLFSQ